MSSPSDYSPANIADDAVTGPATLYPAPDYCSPDMRLIRRAKQLQRLGASPKFLLCAIVERQLQAITEVLASRMQADAINAVHET